MRNNYLCIIIGLLLMSVYLNVSILDSLIQLISYGFIFYGIYQLSRLRVSESLQTAKWLTLGLILFEILKEGIARVLQNQDFLTLFMIFLIMVVQTCVFYLVIKSEGDASESLTIQTYQQAYLLLGIGSVILYLLSNFFENILILSLTCNFCLFVFSIYVFYYIRSTYHPKDS